MMQIMPKQVPILFLTLLAAGCAPTASENKAGPDAAAPAPTATALTPLEVFSGYDVVDLSVLVAENLPGHWGANPPLQRWTNNWFAPAKNAYGTPMPSEGPYYSQRYVIDEHTGTQSDYPAHFVPPPSSGLPGAGPMGDLTGDKYPLDRMMGPAVVIDVAAIRDKAENGKSAVITLDMIKEWEKANGEIKAREVVLFRSGYTDAYYKPMPEGLRLTFQPVVAKTAPGWPAPAPDVMEYLHGKGVWHLGTDGPSMGPAEGGQIVHQAGLKHGMSWEEMLIGLDKLPARGAFYIALGAKVKDMSGSITRAAAFVPRKK
jgi:kynurenine formamidase